MKRPKIDTLFERSSAIGLSLLCVVVTSNVWGQSVSGADESIESVQTILDALAPPPRTRGIDSRGIESEGPPSIDLQSITFAFDSADLTQRGRAVLDNVGQALMSPRLAGVKITIEGHTDASGPEEYNQALSERRAESARSYLLANFDLDGALLVPMGYGETHLLEGLDPLDADNRRVTLVSGSSDDGN